MMNVDRERRGQARGLWFREKEQWRILYWDMMGDWRQGWDYSVSVSLSEKTKVLKLHVSKGGTVGSGLLDSEDTINTDDE